MSEQSGEIAMSDKTAKGKEIMDRLEAGAGDRVTGLLAGRMAGPVNAESC